MSLIHKTSKKHASSDVVYYCLYGYFFLGMRKAELAKTYNKNITTISRWIKKYMEEGFYSRSETKKLAKFHSEHREWLLELYNKIQQSICTKPNFTSSGSSKCLYLRRQFAGYSTTLGIHGRHLNDEQFKLDRMT